MQNPFLGKRPEHPDLWRLSAIVRKLDDRFPLDPNKLEESWEVVFEELGIDLNSVTWLAMQRAFRGLGIETVGDLNKPGKRMQVTLVAAAWLEAFAVATIAERERDDG